MIKCNDLYDYGYKIYQNDEYFKFSIDSILLGEFITLKDNYNVLDLCTGNAPIPLILTTRNQNIKVDGVEIQEEIYELAEKSIKENKLEDIINVYLGNIKDIKLEKKYDIISCNPPYFKINEGSYLNKNKIKMIARHEIELTLEDVISTANYYLKEKGTFYLVHRTERLLETINLLAKYHFGIRKIVFVQTKSEQNAEFFLLEASKYKKDDLKVNCINIENLKTYKNIFKEG